MEKIRELYNKYYEQISYLFFGGLTTAVNFLNYSLFAELIFARAGSLETVAQGIAWFVSVLFAFFTNKFLVFRDKSKEKLAREFLTFFGARALSGVFEIGGFAFFVELLNFNDYAVKIGLAVFVVIANYVLSKFLIFKK